MKIAVVGLGAIGESHLYGLSLVDCFTLSAVCDINEEVAQKHSEKYGVPYFTDYKELAEKTDAEAVVLNLPHWLHCEVTEFFLNTGFHVLLEKPMANTPEECQRMMLAQKRSGKVLAVAHPQRFFQANRVVKEFVQSGELGKLTMITEFRSVDYFEPSRPKWFLNKKLSGGGILMNYGAHALDKIMYITDSKPVNICSSVGNWKNDHDIDGHAQVFMKLENGVSANITFSGYDFNGYENYYFFTNGALKISGGTRLYRCIDKEWVQVELPKEKYYIASELVEFAKLINGEPSEIPSAQFGADVIDVIDKVYNG